MHTGFSLDLNLRVKEISWIITMKYNLADCSGSSLQALQSIFPLKKDPAPWKTHYFDAKFWIC